MPASLGGWAIDTGQGGGLDSIGLVSTPTYNGGSALRVNGPNTGNNTLVFLKNVPVTAGTTYTWSFQAQAEAGTATKPLGVLLLYYTGTNLSGFVSSSTGATSNVGSGAWTWVSHSHQVPATVQFASFYVVVYGSTASTDHFVVDLAVARTTSAQPAAPGTNTLVSGNIVPGGYVDQDFATTPESSAPSASGTITLSGTAVGSGGTSTGGGSITYRGIIGGGGHLTAIDYPVNLTGATVGTPLTCTDTYGAYRWDAGNSTWVQLFTKASMPSLSLDKDIGFGDQGCYAIAQAPSNPTVIYAVYVQKVWRSADSGVTWVQTATQPTTTVAMDPNDQTARVNGPKMAVDPRNANHVLLGTSGTDGLWRTTDGGATWAKVSSVPAGTAGANSANLNGVGFDRLSVATGGGLTSRAMVIVYGSGAYQSTDGAATFTATGTGQPAGNGRGYFGPSFTIGGTSDYYYVSRTTGIAYRYRSGVWANINQSPTGNTLETVAVHPTTAGLIFTVAGGGGLRRSTDGGTSFEAFLDQNSTSIYHRAATDIPWLADGGTNETYMSIGEIIFWPGTTDLLFAQGIGVWRGSTGPYPSSFTWTSMTKGIEQIVVDEVLGVPASVSTVRVATTGWDRAIFRSQADGNFPTRHSPPGIGQGTPNFQDCRGIALDPLDPQRWVNTALDRLSINQAQAGYSLDAGATWTRFPTLPNGAHLVNQTFPYQVVTKYWSGGCAISGNSVVWTAQSGDPVQRQPWGSNDLGTTWSAINLTRANGTTLAIGDYTSFGGWQTYFVRHIICADPLIAGRFYMYGGPEGVWRSSGGALSWTQVKVGEITPFSTIHGLLRCAPGRSGDLWFCPGQQSGTPGVNQFFRSTDAGVTWANVGGAWKEVYAFGFGEPATPGGYPTVFAYGQLAGAFGFYTSTDAGATWSLVVDAIPGWDRDWCTSIDGLWGTSRVGQFVAGFRGSGAVQVTPATSAAPTASGSILLFGTAPALTPVAPIVGAAGAITLSGTAVPTNYSAASGITLSGVAALTPIISFTGPFFFTPPPAHRHRWHNDPYRPQEAIDRLWRRVPDEEASSVWLVGGTYTITDPGGGQTPVFRGGYRYPVDLATAQALIASGFTVET